MRAGAASIFALGAIALFPATVGGHLRPHRARTPASFQGSCTFSGVVRFEQLLTVAPQSMRDVASATGTCSGTLSFPGGKAQSLQGVPVAYSAIDSGPNASCELSAGATGTGRLVFPSGPIRFVLSENRLGTVATLSLAGRTGGSGFGSAVAGASANATQAVQQCMSGGLPQVPVDIRLQTASAISG